MQPFTRRLQGQVPIPRNPFTAPAFRQPMVGLPRMVPPQSPLTMTPQQLQLIRNMYQQRQPVASSRQGPKF